MSEKSAAILTIKEPGSFTQEGAGDIARWLREHAYSLEHNFTNYTTGTFRARYLYSDADEE